MLIVTKRAFVTSQKVFVPKGHVCEVLINRKDALYVRLFLGELEFRTTLSDTKNKGWAPVPNQSELF